MHHSLQKRLKSLEIQAKPSKPEACYCLGPWPKLDFTHVTTDELERLIELDEACRLPAPEACPLCGRRTLSIDLGLLTEIQDAERLALLEAWSSRDPIGAGVWKGIEQRCTEILGSLRPGEQDERNR